MEKITNQYFKSIQALLIIFSITNVYAERLASHAEVMMFRDSKRAEIDAKKAQKDSRLEVIGALGVLDDDLTAERIDGITFSRFVLGIMIGNGYPAGVTKNLQANAPETRLIEDAIKKAAAYGRNFNFAVDQIWSTPPTGAAALDLHVRKLNDLARGVPARAPLFNYEPRQAERYQSLGQIITHICESFNGTPSAPMMQQALLLSRNEDNRQSLPIKQFILNFPLLSHAEQTEIVKAYPDMITRFVNLTEICLRAWTNLNDIKQFIRHRIEQQAIEQRAIDRVRPYIEAIPNNPIQNLSPQNSALEQREALRDFVAILNPPAAPDPRAPVVPLEPLTSQQKEACLNALFNTKLNGMIPAAARAISPAILILINAIPTEPIIGNRQLAMNLGQVTIGPRRNEPINDCTRQINDLPDIEKDVHYRALLEKIKRMAPTFPRNDGEEEADFQARKARLATTFQEAHTRLIDRLIRNRIEAITPPRELISPDTVVVAPADLANPGNVIDHKDNLGFIVGDPGAPLTDVFIQNAEGVVTVDSLTAFETRLKNFLISHWSSYYKLEANEVDPLAIQAVKDRLQAKFNAINAQPFGTIVDKKRRKVALVESIAHQLLSHRTVLHPAMEEYLNAVAVRNIQVQDRLAERLETMGLVLNQDPETEQQLRPIVEAEIPLVPAYAGPLGLDYTDIRNLQVLVNAAVVPESHVYTMMKKIKELPSIKWNDELENHVFYGHPSLYKQPGEADDTYQQRIETYQQARWPGEAHDDYQQRIATYPLPHLEPQNAGGPRETNQDYWQRVGSDLLRQRPGEAEAIYWQRIGSYRLLQKPGETAAAYQHRIAQPDLGRQAGELDAAYWQRIGRHPLRQQPGEAVTAYWQRIGRHLIDIYNRKVKPHIYPANLLVDLTANRAPDLVPFLMMFSDSDDAGNAINYPAEDHPGEQQRIFRFNIPDELLGSNAATKQKLHDSYQKVDQFVQNSLEKLFALPITNNALPWPFCERLGDGIPQPINLEFDLQRQELCKKMLLSLTYFDQRAAAFGMIGTLAGRFTHCADGKKGAIESVGCLALDGFKGRAENAIAIEDFDPYLKQIVLNNFKGNSIDSASDHPTNPESVSIITNIKYRHRNFWNVPTEAQAQFGLDSEIDYAVRPNLLPDGINSNIDMMLRYFYQHVYVGPHELVNVIYKYLLSVDAHKRKGFLGLVTAMLGQHRPFADWIEDAIDYTPLVLQRYCEIIPPTAEAIEVAAALGEPLEPDYILTRKGIEMILFYAGYLAWNGAPGAHPLIADWRENLAWLRANDAEAYGKIYTQ